MRKWNDFINVSDLKEIYITDNSETFKSGFYVWNDNNKDVYVYMVSEYDKNNWHYKIDFIIAPFFEIMKEFINKNNLSLNKGTLILDNYLLDKLTKILKKIDSEATIESINDYILENFIY